MITNAKKIFVLFIIILSVILFSALPCNALREETHKAINKYIADKNSTLSGFSLHQYLQKQLGMQKGSEEFVNNKMIFEWIGDGGESEDAGIRSLNHFLNPINNQGLLGNYSALQWATLLVGTQPLSPISSWNDVRSYYLKALTSTDKATREDYFARTFQGVGQVMHLVQDMSVPAHARVDAHVAGDAYEAWFLIRDVPPITSYPVNSFKYFSITDSTFLIPQLFDNEQYRSDNLNPAITLSNNIGLAEYTNANFLSAGTIFKNFTYPSYNPGVSIAENLQGEVLYLKKIGEGETVNYFARAGRFYQKLPADYKSLALMVDDNKVHENYAQLLIPRAIGYSSQVLSYFFRAKMDLVQDQPPSGSYVIQNDSNEKMDGEFHLYYDNTDDFRVEITNGDFPITSMVIEGSSKSTSINFTVPTDAKNPGEYILVFHGNMGAEIGAAAGKVIQQPMLLVTIEPDSLVIGDVEEKITNYNVTLDATIAYVNGLVQYWLDMYNYYISIIPIDPNAGVHAAEALQASEAFGVIRDQLVQEKLHWAQFLVGIKDIANAPTRFIGGSAATDFNGKFSELTAHYYAAYLDKSVPLTWSTIPAIAKEHTFLTGPGVGGNPVIFLMYKTKAGMVRDAQEASILCNNFYFSAPFILNPALRVDVNGLLWIEGPQGTLPQVTKNDFTLNTSNHVDVWMSATVIDSNNFPTWNHTLTMNMKLFSFDFKVKKE